MSPLDLITHGRFVGRFTRIEWESIDGAEWDWMCDPDGTHAVYEIDRGRGWERHYIPADIVTTLLAQASADN